MSREIKDLTPQLFLKAGSLVVACEKRGVEVLIYSTYRTPEEQAELYRRGRTSVEIRNKCYKLRKRKLGFVAEIIENVGPQTSNDKVTNACPYESWHNLREAFDLVPLNTYGDCDWDNDEKWNIIFEEAEKLGLNCGGRWKRFIDKPHIQLRSGSNPLRVYTPEQILKIIDNNKLK